MFFLGMAGFIGANRFTAMNRSSGFPYAGNGFSIAGGSAGFGVNRFGGIGSFNNFGAGSFGGIGSFGGGFNNFANPLSGLGGGLYGNFGLGGFGGLGAAFGFFLGSLLGNFLQGLIAGKSGSGASCGQCQQQASHPSRDNQDPNYYMDGSSEPRWEDDGYNVTFDV